MRVLSCKTLKVVSHERHCGKAACQEFGGVEVEVCTHPGVKEDLDARVLLLDGLRDQYKNQVRVCRCNLLPFSVRCNFHKVSFNSIRVGIQ